jgi:hypothetical protein
MDYRVEKCFLSPQRHLTCCFEKIYRYQHWNHSSFNFNKMSGKKYENGCFLKPQLLTDRKRRNRSVIFCRILPVFTGLKSFFRPAGPDRSKSWTGLKILDRFQLCSKDVAKFRILKYRNIERFKVSIWSSITC